MDIDPETVMTAAGPVFLAIKAAPKLWETLYAYFVEPAIQLKKGKIEASLKVEHAVADARGEREAALIRDDTAAELEARRRVREDMAQSLTAPAHARVSPLNERAETRFWAEEIRRQENFEAVLRLAVDRMPAEQNDEPVDPDWTARLVRHVKEVSNPEMQALWAEVLAREVAKPGQFSLDTLDVLANLTQREARLFERLAMLRWEDGIPLVEPEFDPPIGTAIDDETKFPSLPEVLGLQWADLRTLVHHRLVDRPTRGRRWKLMDLHKPELQRSELVVGCAGGTLQFEGPHIGHGSGDLYLRFIGLTPAGVEIASLITEPVSRDVFERWTRWLECGARARLNATLTYLVNGEPRYTHTWQPQPQTP